MSTSDFFVAQFRLLLAGVVTHVWTYTAMDLEIDREALQAGDPVIILRDTEQAAIDAWKRHSFNAKAVLEFQVFVRDEEVLSLIRKVRGGQHDARG